MRDSPCDVLPEDDTLRTVGSVAHPRGYPRLIGGMPVYNEQVPHPTPDVIVRWALSRGVRFENEVHDCQRLVMVSASDSSFGPLVGLIPLRSAMLLTDAGFGPTGIAIATVYNWGDTAGAAQPYDTLKLGDGWNCLWLRRSTGGTWSAAITPDEPTACDDRNPPPAGAFELDVLRAHHASPMPHTARWGWDAHARQHTMGVKCGDAWCWIGSQDLFADTDVQLSGPAHTTIPGYFDEQHLAVPDPADPTRIVPGPYARITPSQEFYDLAVLQQDNPQDVTGSFYSGGSPVARIEIPNLNGPTPAPYAGRWGSSNRPVTLHMQSTGGPGLPLVSVFRAGGGNAPPRAPNRIQGVQHAAVGAVRWRWHDTAGTESIWNACGVRLTDCCDTE
ncbi:MAG TPA: hypothetical protein VF039_09880 [Longimicrobiales bacterium]